MTTHSLEVFNQTSQTTNIWLNQLMVVRGPDSQVAPHVLGSAPPTLRHDLCDEYAAHVGAQLPLLVRGAYDDKDQPALIPERSMQAFMYEVMDELRITRAVDPKQAVKVVSAVSANHIGDGRSDKIRAALPRGITTHATSHVPRKNQYLS